MVNPDHGTLLSTRTTRSVRHWSRDPLKGSVSVNELKILANQTHCR